LEAYASGRAFAELGRQAALDGDSPALAGVLGERQEITAKDVLLAAQQGDPASQGIVDCGIDLLGAAVPPLVMTLDPDGGVVGGGVMSNGYFGQRILSDARLQDGDAQRVLPALLGARSVMCGAMAFLSDLDPAVHSPSNGHPALDGARLEAVPAEKGAG